jgi:hypothetical protein
MEDNVEQHFVTALSNNCNFGIILNCIHKHLSPMQYNVHPPSTVIKFVNDMQTTFHKNLIFFI